MTALASKGLSLSERLLNSHNTSNPGQFSESMHRAWWMSYLCRCNASIVSCTPFDEPIDSSSSKAPYPSSGEAPEVWAQYIRAEEALVAATLMLAALLKGFNSETTASSFNRNIGALDAVITHQLNQSNLGQPRAPVDNPESKLAICLHITTRARLMSARIKLHRYRAFMDHPQILRRFESIPPLDTSIGLAQGQVMHGNSGISQKASLVFPFSSNHSHEICLESATGIATELETLAGMGVRTTPVACSANLAGFTLMMISHFQTSANAPDHSMPSSAILDVHNKCKTQVKIAVNALNRFSNAFSFVKALKGQLVTAAVACDLYDTDLSN
ncbi:hypothetical protein BDP55DRAFT_324950 [Colletotrichum godetiae]|uniref:Transcription factor domain-containing protein n=1 Tax=Colletotrichum godetiae TaxID=1209918 RepID=A0AAJ0ABI1_9PEZI|nr:uncharacterized protein BDP55DRAFT_324950 [Colletotrichum godetiae]KAK1660087.1 hypothetical protein BDP55DRAFT_324950 [Colletotrichum godetiae]